MDGWLCWVFVSVQGLSLVAASGGHSSSRCAGLSPSRPLLLRSTGSRRAGSVTVAHGPSCSAARGIFPDQGSNPCPLHWQANYQPLRHQGSPLLQFFFFFNFLYIFLMLFLSAYILFMYVCMYVCMAVLGLRFCVRAFSSCGKRGPLFIVVQGPLFITVRRPLTIAASRC